MQWLALTAKDSQSKTAGWLRPACTDFACSLSTCMHLTPAVPRHSCWVN